MQTDEASIRKCLQVSVEVNAAPHLLMQCLEGQFGDLHRRLVVNDIGRVLRAAELELEQLVVHATDDPQGQEPFLFEIRSSQRWSAYDLRLVDELGTNLAGGMFFEETLRLVRETENRCIELLSEQLGSEFVAKRSTRSYLFWKLYVLGAITHHLPGLAIVEAELRGRCREGVRPDTQSRIIELVRQPDRLSMAEAYLCLSLLEWDAGSCHNIIPDLLEYCWKTGVYHLTLLALERARECAHSVTDAVGERIKHLLNGFQSSNIFLSNVIVEAMCAYGMVESPVNESQASSELAEILKSPDSAESNVAAYGAISKICEDVYDGAYYEAVERLPLKERCRLYTMAALGAPSYAFDTEWLLRRLIEIGDESALPAFLHCATAVDGESVFPQEVAARFILAHAGSAKYLQTPAKLADLSSDDRRAWQYYGEIIFWLHRPGLTAEQVRERCEPLWERLESQVPFEAVDPLMRFAHAMRMVLKREHHPVQKLFVVFRERICRILASGLKNREHLSGIDKRIQTKFACRERTSFIIHTLGQVGTVDDIKLLEPLLDDRYHGRDTVGAIRRLRENRPFVQLSVVHGFP